VRATGISSPLRAARAANGNAPTQAPASDGAEAGGPEARAAPPPEHEAARVSVALRRLTDSTVELLAKCELLLACSGPDEAKQKVEAAILRISTLVRREFGGVVLTDSLLM
jgi:hypothetical protein